MKSPSLWQLGMHFLPKGGVDRYFDDLLKGLERTGASFTAAAFDGQPTDDVLFRRLSLGASKSPIWKRAAALRRFGSEFAAVPPPKILASHFSFYAFFLLPFLRGAKHVVHFHGPWADEAAASGASLPGVLLRKMIERKVYSKADHFITLSRSFRLLLIEEFGILPEKISVIPGCVDLEKFHPRPDRDTPRQLLGWPLKRKIIFCIRRLVERMGIAELLGAFAEIAGRFPDVDLHIGGRGALEEELRRCAWKLGLGQRVVFCGYVPDEDLPEYYSAADFSIVPSQCLEGFGLVALESLACGVPVLVTPVGGLPEVVSGLKHRLVLEGTDRTSIAKGLVNALGVPGYLPSASDCRSFVKNNYSIPSMARRVMEVYRQTALP